jgi:hypothetical protein
MKSSVVPCAAGLICCGRFSTRGEVNLGRSGLLLGGREGAEWCGDVECYEVHSVVEGAIGGGEQNGWGVKKLCICMVDVHVNSGKDAGILAGRASLTTYIGVSRSKNSTHD